MNIAGWILVSLLIRFGTSEEDVCQESKWKEIPDENKFVMMSMNRLAYTEAERSCAYFGGSLLTIHNAATQKFIKHYVKGLQACDDVIYLGLVSPTDGMLTWADGTFLGNYHRFNKDPSEAKAGFCTTVDWCASSNKWFQNICVKKRRYICETVVPCSTRPHIGVGEHRPMENDTISIATAGDFEVKCFLMGYPNHKANISVVCEWDADNVGGEDGITVRIGRKTHGKKCECHSKHDDGKRETVFVKIFFPSPPVLIGDSLNGTIILATEGSSAGITLIVFAVPDIKNRSVSKDGSLVNPTSYTITISPRHDPGHHLVTIAMRKIKLDLDGMYYVTFENGLEENMHFMFILHVAALEKAVGPPSRYVPLVAIMIPVIMLIGIAYTIVRANRTATEQHGDESESEICVVVNESELDRKLTVKEAGYIPVRRSQESQFIAIRENNEEVSKDREDSSETLEIVQS